VENQWVASAPSLAKRLIGTCWVHVRLQSAWWVLVLGTSAGFAPTPRLACAQQAPPLNKRRLRAKQSLGMRLVCGQYFQRLVSASHTACASLRKRQACAQCARMVRETFSIRLFSPNVRRMCAECAPNWRL
jgi:hypothetical protein